MFNNLILEALKPSQFRPYVKINREETLKSYLGEVFSKTKFETNHTKDRIYFPFDIEIANNIDYGIKYKQISIFLKMPISKYKYEIVDYVKGTCRKIGDTNPNNIFKIGKILQKETNNTNPEVAKRAQFLLDSFIEDKNRQFKNSGKYLICISKHPYDIAGMSTDRGWTSCMDVNKGVYRETLKPLIKNNGLVAYLISDNDKNIEHPMGRVTLYPMFNPETKKYNYQISGMCYGSVLSENFNISTEFKKIIQNWIDENFKDEDTDYYIRISGIYDNEILPVIGGSKVVSFLKEYELAGITIELRHNDKQITLDSKNKPAFKESVNQFKEYYRNFIIEKNFQNSNLIIMKELLNNLIIKGEIAFGIPSLAKNLQLKLPVEIIEHCYLYVKFEFENKFNEDKSYDDENDNYVEDTNHWKNIEITFDFKDL